MCATGHGWRWAKTPRLKNNSMNKLIQSRWAPIALLTCSNIFMTFAWYGHLKHKTAPLLLVILASWGIAFFEYCFQVPANRIGHVGGMSGAQLKIMQEAITLSVFVVFSILYLKEPLKWNYCLGFSLVLAAVFVVFHQW